MFLTANCIEAQTGVVHIKDIKAPVMQEMIQYMYIGKIDDFGSISIDLFKAADKYDVQSLKVDFIHFLVYLFVKELCAQDIAKTLSAKTLFDIVILAYMYNCEFLKNVVAKFLLANLKAGHFTDLISSDNWIDFASENKELAREIIKDVSGRVKISY
jgi:hypothetical protein